MMTPKIMIPAALVLAAAAGTALLAPKPASAVTNLPQHPQHPGQPTLVYAQRFKLERPTHHYWRATAPLYDSGWLLVLAAEPGLLVPHEKWSPVLYVGAQTADRVNVGVESGRVVVIVPGDFFLVDTPIFFGPPALPEELTGADIQRELDRAVAAGKVPPSADTVARVLDNPLELPSVGALRSRAIDLVEKYSPSEQDLIRGSRVPLVK